MNLKRIAGASALTLAVGLAGLLGTGVGSAGAEPGPPCGPQPGSCQDGRGGPGGGPDFDHRGIDDARRDHQPFNYNGQRVNPVWDDGHHGWGFWLGPIWIPL
jgi:hypothetical protein